MYMHAFLTLALHGGQLHTHADAPQAKEPRRSVDRMQGGPLWPQSPPANSRIPIVMKIPGVFGDSKIMTFAGAQCYRVS